MSSTREYQHHVPKYDIIVFVEALLLEAVNAAQPEVLVVPPVEEDALRARRHEEKEDDQDLKNPTTEAPHPMEGGRGRAGYAQGMRGTEAKSHSKPDKAISPVRDTSPGHRQIGGSMNYSLQHETVRCRVASITNATKNTSKVETTPNHPAKSGTSPILHNRIECPDRL